MSTNTPALSSSRIDVPDTYDAIQDYYEEQGWTDGMPVVPATEDAVRRMLGPWGEDPSLSLGVAQPSNAEVTIEKVAVNAVMAGCRPEYFPVVVACVRAALQTAVQPGRMPSHHRRSGPGRDRQRPHRRTVGH